VLKVRANERERIECGRNNCLGSPATCNHDGGPALATTRVARARNHDGGPRPQPRGWPAPATTRVACARNHLSTTGVCASVGLEERDRRAGVDILRELAIPTVGLGLLDFYAPQLQDILVLGERRVLNLQSIGLSGRVLEQCI
jgi:hypothetical protein